MVHKKIDPVSRVIAFITAFAFAMLTVTLVHRTVISAEVSHGAETSYSDETSVADYEETTSQITDGTESSDTETDASSDNTDISDTQSDSDTSAIETDVSLDETANVSGEETNASLPENTLEAPNENESGAEEETDASLPENTMEAPSENENGALEYNAAMLSIDPLTEKVTLPANGIIKPENLELTTGTGHILQDGTVVKQGDTVRLDFNWRIENSDTSDYSNTIFQYDITDNLKGIKLDDGYKPYIVEGVLKAEYTIKTTEDNRTLILIEPKSGFGAEYKDRAGSIRLEGKVDLSGYNKETSDVTLEYFGKEIKVKAPELAPVLYVNKEAVANGITKKGSDYYQRYRITVKNDSDAPQVNTTLLDMPGKIFTKDAPAVVSVKNSNDTEIGTACTSVFPDANVSGQYKIALNSTIEKGQHVTIEYDMKIDQSTAFNPKTTWDDTKNEVRIERNEGEQSYPSNTWINLDQFRPTVSKSGVFDGSNENIIWTITVSSNFMDNADFTVTDTPSEKLTSENVKAAIEAALKKNGKDITIGNDLKLNKEAFTERDDGQNKKTYVLEYTTPVPDDAKKGDLFVNDVKLEYPNSQNDNEYTDNEVCKYDFNIEKFAEKRLLGITDDTFEWEVKVTPKPYKNNDISKIEIFDKLDNIWQYNNGEFTFEEISIEIAGQTYTVTPDQYGNNEFPIEGLGTYKTGWLKLNEAAVTITNTEILGKAVNTDIIVKFKTKVSGKLTVNDITDLLNVANCKITYSNGENFENRAAARYTTGFAVSKGLEYSDGDINKDALRNKAFWNVIIDINDKDKLSTDKNTELTFTDTIDPAYTFDLSGSGVENYVKLYIAWSWGATYQPLTVQPDSSWTFDKNTVTGKIIITPEEAELLKKPANDGKYFKIKVLYYTQMEKEYYKQFNTKKTYSETFTNTATVTWEGETHRDSSTVTAYPDNKRVFEKAEPRFEPEKDIDAYFTLYVNRDGAKLGTGKTITVTDKPGYNLDFNPKSVKITPEDGVNYVYDEKTRTITFTLKNETPYTIEYSTKVTQLNAYEYDLNDNIDNDRDNELINRIFTNKAELSYENNNGDKFSGSAMLNDYRSDVSIQSKFSADGDDKSDDKETIFLTINKEWDDEKNPAGKIIDHDEPVIVYIAKYNSKGERVAETKEPPRIAIHPYKGEYYKIIQNLVKYDNKGNPYSYEILKENEIPGYTFSATKMTPLNKTVTDINGKEHEAFEINVKNTYNSTNLFVTKNWVDNNNENKNRPEEITFTVFQSVEREGETITTEYGKYTMTAKDGWELAVRNLPEFDEKGSNYVYTIKEDAVKGYVVPSGLVSANGTEVVTFNGEIFPAHTYVLTNEEDTPVPDEKIRLTVTKSWNDDGKSAMRSKFVSFDLYKDGKLIDDNVSLTTKNLWSYTFFELDKYQTDADGNYITDENGNRTECVYSVKENLDNPNYSSSVSGMKSTEESGKYTITIENKFDPKVPADKKISINVEKKWSGDDEYLSDRSKSVEFVLYQNGKMYTQTEYNNTLSGSEWKTTISDLPMYYINSNGYVDLCEYTIKEKTENSRYTVKNPDPIAVSEEQTSYDAVISNTHKDPDYTSVSVKKIWEDGKYKGKIDHEKDEVVFQLLKNNEVFKEETLNQGNDWKFVFEHLEKTDSNNNPYAYTVREIYVNKIPVEQSRYAPRYTQPAEGNGYKAEITNTYKPDELPTTKVTLTVNKIWKDKGHEEERPDSITINVKETHTGKITSFTIDPTNKLSDTWVDSAELMMYYLDEKGIKQLCEYEISEADVENYLPGKADPIKTEADKQKYTAQITNSYIVPTEEKVDLTVTKKWENKGHTNGIKEIQFELYRNDTLIGTYSITEKDGWKYTVKDLEKSYILDGTAKDYDYSIEEIGTYENYTVSYSKLDTSNKNNYKITITNTRIGSKPVEPDKPDNPDESEKPSESSEQTTVTTSENKTYPVVTPFGYTATTVTETTTNHSDTEDVSAEAGFADDEADAVKRDTIMIFILLGVIITGTSILIYRRHSADYDKKYHM